VSTLDVLADIFAEIPDARLIRLGRANHKRDPGKTFAEVWIGERYIGTLQEPDHATPITWSCPLAAR
jgi:hypothetical protein